jgi:hypothetical protein
VAIAAADDLNFPEAGASDRGFHFPPLITRVALVCCFFDISPARFRYQELIEMLTRLAERE